MSRAQRGGIVVERAKGRMVAQPMRQYARSRLDRPWLSTVKTRWMKQQHQAPLLMPPWCKRMSVAKSEGRNDGETEEVEACERGLGDYCGRSGEGQASGQGFCPASKPWLDVRWGGDFGQQGRPESTKHQPIQGGPTLSTVSTVPHFLGRPPSLRTGTNTVQ